MLLTKVRWDLVGSTKHLKFNRQMPVCTGAWTDWGRRSWTAAVKGTWGCWSMVSWI